MFSYMIIKMQRFNGGWLYDTFCLHSRHQLCLLSCYVNFATERSLIDLFLPPIVRCRETHSGGAQWFQITDTAEQP